MPRTSRFRTPRPEKHVDDGMAITRLDRQAGWPESTHATPFESAHEPNLVVLPRGTDAW